MSAVFPLGYQRRQAFVSVLVPAQGIAYPMPWRMPRPSSSESTDKLTARLGSVMSRRVIPKRKRAQGRARKRPSSQSSSGVTQEVNEESPRCLDGQRPGRSTGENLRGPQDSYDPPPNMSKNWTLRQTSGRPSCQTVPHRSWSNKINLSDCSILWVSTFPSRHKRTKTIQDLQTGFHSFRNSESFKLASMSFVK